MLDCMSCCNWIIFLLFTSNLKHNESLGRVHVQEKLCQNFIKIENFIT